MSTISLDDIKRDLRVTTNDDDALLQILTDAAEDEACQFLNAVQLPETPSVYSAVFLLVRAKYDTADVDELKKIRQAAEMILQPLRDNIGI